MPFLRSRRFVVSRVHCIDTLEVATFTNQLIREDELRRQLNVRGTSHNEKRVLTIKGKYSGNNKFLRINHNLQRKIENATIFKFQIIIQVNAKDQNLKQNQ